MSQHEQREWQRLAQDMALVTERLDRAATVLGNIADTLIYGGAKVKQLNYELKRQGAAEVKQEQRLAA